ncbi:hypothetical protein K458DRAFT_117080 [Lentithecium fluviatile CBS 122367]|uniref:Uncharacterized protein n=1 Tax=Lentithecium fluviatile CBS 122367 TaxID=1168545 RepID=A0A6G1IML9_9PLEO|nr:hypothetical protein K458DRAFT_117080 [Lentithecium fluviatile CBS 122367]
MHGWRTYGGLADGPFFCCKSAAAVRYAAKLDLASVLNFYSLLSLRLWLRNLAKGAIVGLYVIDFLFFHPRHGTKKPTHETRRILERSCASITLCTK